MSAGFGEQPVSAPESPNVPNVAPVPTPPSIETVTPPAASAHSSVPPPPLPPPAPASGFAAPASGASASFYPRPQPPVSAAITWPRAGLPIRLAALAIDGILIGLIMAFIDGLLPRMLEIDSGPGGWLVALAIYGALMWKHKGTTIGGIVCGLKVVRVDQREVDWPTAIVRALACFLSLAVVGLGFIWVAIDDDKQSWHDKIAGTAVVVVPKGVSLI
jgi:uncharacterized RDD family membrane protein YckC